jgi:hypothetical protein
MLGYKEQDVAEMLYGVQTAILLINTDENPAIHRYLSNTADLLEGLLAEGHV